MPSASFVILDLISAINCSKNTLLSVTLVHSCNLQLVSDYGLDMYDTLKHFWLGNICCNVDSSNLPLLLSALLLCGFSEWCDTLC